jgi:hypothetical protein
MIRRLISDIVDAAFSIVASFDARHTFMFDRMLEVWVLHAIATSVSVLEGRHDMLHIHIIAIAKQSFQARNPHAFFTAFVVSSTYS